MPSMIETPHYDPKLRLKLNDADRKSKRGFGTMAREVIMCTGARSGDDSGHDPPPKIDPGIK